MLVILFCDLFQLSCLLLLTKCRSVDEILTATFVLTFYDDAEDFDIDVLDDAALSANKTNLRKLVRKTNNTPLRFFITGPAGAGKCKLKSLCMQNCHKKNC